MGNTKININNAIIIYPHGVLEIQLVVVSCIGTVLYMEGLDKVATSEYLLRSKCVERLRCLIETYDVNTLIMEENKLFIESIDRYPDPYLLRNVQLGFGIRISIEDNFLKVLDNILELPRKKVA